MAVYKPTNCQPYLTTFDLLDCIEEQTATLFECKVDTSNREVTAYAMTLYNSENTQIFPVDTEGNPVEPQNNITFVSDLKSITGISGLPIASSGYTNLNSGINGSYLHIPFFVGSAQYNSYSPSGSSIMYNMLRVAQGAEGEIIVSATNRVTTQSSIVITNGQQYKWVITLFQGVEKNQGTNNPVFPKSIYQYDMIVTTGQVMGSNNERIQSYLSEEIYVDYYVQPVRFNGGITIDDEELGLWHPTVSNEEPDPVGSRVMIKNYDSSYGYIYPMTGGSGFAPNTIKKGNSSENANAFQIYTMANNSEDLTATRMVAVVPYATVPWTWEQMLSDEGSSNGAQSFYVYVGNDISIPTTFYPFDTTYEPTLLGGVESNPINQFLQGDTKTIAVTEQARIVLNYQAKNNDYYANHLPSEWQSYPLISNPENASPYNGIYTPTISVDSRVQIGGSSEDTDNYYRKVTITWRRASDANTWGELSNKVVMVTWSGDGNSAKFGGKNIQTQVYDDDGNPIEDQTTVGTLNASPVKFIEEKAISIYTHDRMSNNEYINNTGIILYNDDPSTTQRTLATLYVRPYIGLEPMMWIRELGLSDATSRFFLVQNVNTTTWAVKYYPNQVYVGNQIPDNENGNASSAIFEIGQRYQIRTFYKSSDENPFNLYSNPTVTMTFGPMNKEDWVSGQGGNLYGTSGSDPVTIASRSFTVSAEYSQVQYIWWKSFNYTLYDMVGNQIATSGDRYDGLMDYTFYGLVDGNRYTLVLTIETYSGNILSLQQELLCSFTEQEISGSFPFDLTFDCSINAVRASFRLTGYIVPNVVDANGNPTGRTVSRADNENNTSPKIKGVSYVNGAMLIAGGANGIDEEGVTYTHTSDGMEQILGRSPLSTENNTVLIESSHTPTSTQFAGNFLCAYFSPDDSEDVLPDDYKFVVYIPDELIIDNEGTHANPDRNKVFYDVLGSNGASVLSDGPGEATLYLQGSSAPEASGKWRNDLIFLPKWQPSELENRFGSSSVVNYKPVDDAVFDMSGGISTRSYYKNINGPFNTMAEYIQKESGQGDNRIAIDWASQAGSASQLKNPLISENDTLIQESSTSSANSIFVSIQTSDGDDFQASDHVLDEDEEPSTYNNFVLVNKMPTLWGDGGFVIASATDETTLWPIVSISATEENGSGPHVATGYIARSYFEQTDKDNCFVWNDDPVVVNEVTCNGRWFDGWGIDNNTATVEGSVIGLNEDDKVVSVTRTYTQEYDADDSNRIYVGNQSQITDGSLTGSERSAITSRTFVIQANIGLNEESSTITNPDVRVYITNN